MIRRIIEIKNTGIFIDHNEEIELAKYNLIYGWNGSGKTTLSRLLASLGKSDVSINLQYPVPEYTLVANYKEQEVLIEPDNPYAGEIWVFNKDFVRENAPSIEDPQELTKPIFAISQEDRDLMQEIKDSRAKIDQQQLELDKLEKRVGSLEDRRETTFTRIARLIKNTLGHDSNYDKRNAKARFDELGGESKALGDDEYKEQLHIVKQEFKDKIDFPSLRIDQATINRLNESIQSNLGDSIERVAIRLYDENDDYHEWAERGYHLHGDKETCLFCDQKIAKERRQTLGAYFNEAYANLVAGIRSNRVDIDGLVGMVKQIQLPDPHAVYAHLQDEYKQALSDLDECANMMLSNLRHITEVLTSKLTKLDQALEVESLIGVEALKRRIDVAGGIVKKHNEHFSKINEYRDEAIRGLEYHYLSEEMRGLTDLATEIANEKRRLGDIETNIEAQKSKIRDAESRLQDTLRPCQELNRIVAKLLGHNEIMISQEERGYLIMRRDNPAYDLSEGEKSAISFSYFLTTLTQSESVQLNEAIVVIDDPLSSLDANMAFRVEALIEARLKSVRQLILLTHSYDLLQKIKRWFMRLDKDTSSRTKLLMLNTYYDRDLKSRLAVIENLDPLLKDFDSEYQYLFSKLVRLVSDDVTPPRINGLEGLYNYPNITRKVLECYFTFRAPGCYTVDDGMNAILAGAGDDINKEDVKDVSTFVNAKSHLNTLTGTLEFDIESINNAPQYVRKALDIIKSDDPRHYSSMIKICTE